MDDINDKLSKILSDPESMDKVRKMAESILSEDEPPGETPAADDLSAVDPAVLARVAGVMKKLQGGGDNRTALLTALSPLVSERRQKKIATAVKLLRLIEILPYLKESGLFDIL